MCVIGMLGIVLNCLIWYGLREFLKLSQVAAQHQSIVSNRLSVTAFKSTPNSV